MKPQTTLQAEKKVKDILENIYYSPSSVTHALIKAVRGGMKGESGHLAFRMMEQSIKEAEEAYRAAIAQPEIRQAIRPVVEL